MRKPNFFIVGAPRCGTTAMWEHLRQHPEVFLSREKEPHFFGKDIGAPWFDRREGQYLSLFSAAGSEKRLGEASVWYLYSRRAAAEIEEFNPQASIIIMLRDPVEMLHSLHNQLVYFGREDIADFREALEAEDDRKRGLQIPKNVAFPESLFYREVAKYPEQVERYLHAFGREKVHVIVYDDLKSDPAGVYARTLRFLDVDPGFQSDFRTVNPNRRIQNKALANRLFHPPRIVRRLFYALPWQVRVGVKENITNYMLRFNSRYEARQPMDTELAERLRAEFAPEVERLSELLGRDLTGWSRTRSS